MLYFIVSFNFMLYMQYYERCTPKNKIGEKSKEG